MLAALLAAGAVVLGAVLAPADLLAIARGPGPTPGPTSGRTADTPAGDAVDATVDATPMTGMGSVRDLRDARPGDVAAGVGTSTDEDRTDAGRWDRVTERPTSGSSYDGPDLEELRGGWRVEAGAEEAAALGVLAAHAWARARGAEGQGASTVVADVVVTLEAVERPGASHAVVTLLVTDGVDVHRLAVPIAFRASGPVVAGTPWLLPSPDTGTAPIVGTAIGDEVLIEAARDALERVGIPGARLVRLEVTEGWPFIARLDDPTEGHPWLRWHLDRFVVTGLPLDRAAEGS